jgi:hypothetical protein
MTDEEERENYLKIKEKIIDLLMDEVRNDTISICNCFTLANELLITFIVASAKSGNIKGKNKAEIADNARSLFTNAHKNAVKLFEELFFGKNDE